MIRTETATLLDEVIPEFDARSRHERRIHAPPEWVSEAVDGYRLGRASWLLFRIRGIDLAPGSLRDLLTASGFAVLAERPGREVVYGTNGQFWALDEAGHMETPHDLPSFRSFDRAGWAQGAISVRIEPLEDGTTLLATETRVRCVDDDARRRFLVYWSLIKPFSGWLRRNFLLRIARIAEGAP